MAESSSKEFNPYHKWLGIPLSEQPPTHYRLLGLEAFEDDADVIDGAADRCMSFVQQFANGPQIQISQKILNELSEARVCLLNPELKTQYDARLKRKLAKQSRAEQPAAQAEPTQTDHAVAQLGQAARRDSRVTRRKKSPIPMIVGGLISAGIVVGAVSWFLNKDKQDDPESKETVAAKSDSEPTKKADAKSKPNTRKTKTSPRVAKTDSTGKKPTVNKPTYTMPPDLPSGLMAMSPEWREAEPSPATLSALDEIKKRFEEDTTFHQLVEIVFQPTSTSTAVSTSLQQIISGYGTQPSVKKLLLLFAKQDWPTSKTARQSAIEFLFKESNDDDVRKLAKVKTLQPTEQLATRVKAATLLLTQTSNEADIHTIANYLLFGPDHARELRELALNFYFNHQPADIRPRSLAMRVLNSREAEIRQLGPVAARYLYERHAKDSAAIGTARKIVDMPNQWSEELVALSQKFLDGNLPAVTSPTTPTVSVNPPEPKLPKQLAAVPDDAEVIEAKKQVRTVYKQQFVNAKTPRQKLSLANYLAGRANRIQENDVDRYVLLRESLELAVEVVGVEEALKAIDTLADSYEINRVSEKSQVLSQLAPKMRTATANAAMIQLLFETINDAIAAQEFDSAERLQSVASSVARKLRDRSLTQQVNTLRTKVSELQRDFRANAEAMATLEADPENAEANLVRAKYLCVVKNDWDAGLKFALKSGNESLKALAERDLNRPEATQDALDLAEEFWKLASDRRARLDWLMPAAVYWYKRAVVDLKGLDRDQVDERLKSIGNLKVVRSTRSGAVSGSDLTPQSLSQATALNRRAATWLVQNGRATIRMADGTTDSVYRRRLPEGAFVVISAQVGGNLLEGRHAVDMDDDFKNLSGLTFLESIEIGASVNVTSAGIQYLAASTNLKQFISKSVSLDDDALSVLENMPQLEQLRIENAAVTDDGLDVLQQLSKLRVLSLAGCKITDAGLFKLRRLTMLEHLILSDTTLTGAGLSHLTLLGSLRQLELKDTELTDQFTSSLRTLSSLRQLNVSDTNITDAALKNFPVELTKLNLEGTAITDEGMPAISQLQGLSNLNLDSTKISGRGLRSLTSLPQLSTLSLRGVALVDAYVSTLSQLPSLQTLHLNYTMITDAGLTRLKTAAKLTNLYVGNTQVTDDGVANFKMTRPDCTISTVEMLLDP